MTYLRPMGDDSVQATGPAAVLARQVNRFMAAKVPYQFITAPLPIGNQVTPELALAAVLIYQRKATDSFTQFHDEGSRLAIEAANMAFANPVSFVSSRMAEMTNAVSGMADSLGLPAAASDDQIVGMSKSTLLLIAGVVGVVFLMRKRGGR